MTKSSFFSKTQLSNESFKSLLPDFFLEINEGFDLLKKAADSADSVEVRRLAHKIKGTAASYAAVLIVDKAKILQKKIDDTTVNELTTEVDELGVAIASTHHYAKMHML